MAIALVALLPIIAVLIQRWGRVYIPVGDQATLDLRIRDVWTFSSDTPLTGPWSRFGWNHPGPTMYYLLALFSGVARQRAWASLVGNVLLQGVAVAWIARLSWKSGGLRWMVPWLAVSTLSYWATGPWIFQQLWNPYLPYPFFTLLLLQAWLVGSGQGRRLVGLAFVGSFLVQTHVGYALPVLVVSAWALVRLLVGEHRAGRSMRRWSMWRAPLIVLAVVWFVPLVIDTLAHWPGNAVRLVQFSLGLGPTAHLPLLGVHRALGYLATEFRWWPPWLGGPDPASPFTSLTAPSSVAFLLVPVVLIGADWAVARWRRACRAGGAHRAAGRRRGGRGAGPGPAERPGLPLPVPLAHPHRGGHGGAQHGGAGGGPPPVAASGRLALGGVLAAVTVVASVSFTRTVAAADGPVTSMEPVAASIFNQLHREGQPRGPVLLRSARLSTGRPPCRPRRPAGAGGAPVFVDQGLGYQFGYAAPLGPSRSARCSTSWSRANCSAWSAGCPGPRSWPCPIPSPPASRPNWSPCSADWPTSSWPKAGDQVGDLGSEYVKAAWRGCPARSGRPDPAAGPQSAGGDPHLPVLGHRLPGQPDHLPRPAV